MHEVTYTSIGDYQIPNIVLSELAGEKIIPLGRYASLRKAFLKEHRPAFYNTLLLTEKLFPHLREIEQAAQTRLTAIPDREIAHEIILAELVYN